MSYEERKLKRLKKKKNRRILVISIFAYLILRSVPGVLAKNSRTILVERYNLIDSVDTQGILIMEELALKTLEPINPKKNLEGKRIPVGFEIAKIDSLEDNSSLEEELKRIEKDIEILEKFKNDNELVESKTDRIEDEENEIIKQIDEQITSGDYSNIDKIKDIISKRNEEVSQNSTTDTLILKSLESLEERKMKILEDIDSNNIFYRSEISGILSYKIDGYEKTYIPKEFDNYTYNNLRIPEEINNKQDINGFKIINNLEWYIALKIDDPKSIKEYTENDYILLKLGDTDEEIRGKIVKINNSKDKMSIVVRLNTGLDKYYEDRFPQVSIIRNKKDVYKLPTKALVNKDGQIGVYIKEFTGIVKFKPLSIIKEEKDYTYVDVGDEEAFINIVGHTDPIKTITSYDEVFVNSFNLKEGQILD